MPKFMMLREDVIAFLVCTTVASIALMLAIPDAPIPSRHERCLVGCAQDYAIDATAGAVGRFANCIEHCEGE